MKKITYRIRLFIATFCTIVMLSNFLTGILYPYKYFEDNFTNEDGICFFHNIINPCEHYNQIFKIAFSKYKNLMINSNNHCILHPELANTVKEIATPSPSLKLKDYSKIICFVTSRDSKLILNRYRRVFHPPQTTIVSTI